MSGRCTGHCCRAFTLPYSPEVLARALWAELGAAEGYVDDDGNHWGARHNDLATVVLMVEHLGRMPPTSVPGWLFGSGLSLAEVLFGGWKLGNVHVYRCKNLLPNGDCGIYERRPRICRDYPGRDACGDCHYAGCTYQAPARPDVIEKHVVREAAA